MSNKALELEYSDILAKRNILFAFSLGMPLTIINLLRSYYGTFTLEVIVISSVIGGLPYWWVRRYNKQLKKIRKKIKKGEDRWRETTPTTKPVIEGKD